MNTNNNRKEIKGITSNKIHEDNSFRKCKVILIKNIMNFINNKIKEIYNNNINHGIAIKQLLMVNKKTIEHLRTDFNLMLLEKSLLEIFSENISRKYTMYPQDKNKILIKELLNEKDDDKRNYFENLFNLTFLDCLEHFTTKRVIEELQGMKTFLDIKNDEEKILRLRLDNKEYLDSVEYHFNHYEEILNKRNSRRR